MSASGPGLVGLRPRLVTFLGTILASLILIAPARAGIKAGDAEVGADYGWQHFDPDLLGKIGRRWSLRGGMHSTDRLEWEGQYVHGRVDESSLPGTRRQVTLTEAFVNVVLNFRVHEPIVPYAFLGAGIAKTEIEAVSLRSSDTEAGYQIGGGARFFFGREGAIALRLELVAGGADAFEHSYFHPALGAGLTFRIGRRP